MPMRGLRPRGQAGMGLVDSLVAMIIIATVLVAGLLLVSTLTRTSAMHRDRTLANNQAVAVAEAIDVKVYKKCVAGQNSESFKSSFTASEDSYWSAAGSAAGLVKAGFTATVSVEFLESRTASTAAFQATCPAAGDQGLQRVAVKVVSSGPRAVASTVHITLRNDTCVEDNPSWTPQNPEDIADGSNGVAEC